MAKVHGGRLVAQALKRHGISHVFTLCGGHVQAIYDGCLDEAIRVVDVRHEQTAGHAADGYARLTGMPGVAIVTAGPGVTDTVTALANALRAGVPLVCLGGAGPLGLSDMGSLQDLDAIALLSPVCKWAVRVNEARRLKEYVDAAFRVARADMPGPVYLELPLDVLMSSAEDTDPSTEPAEPARPAADPDRLEAAARLLDQANRPMFIIGSQIRWSPLPSVVEQAASLWGAPFFLNGMARGALPPAHPALFTHSRKQALKESDAIFVFGTPFDFRLNYGRPITFNPQAKVVQVDLQGRELGRNRKVDVGIVGDSGLVLKGLLERARPKTSQDWLMQLRQCEAEKRQQMETEIAGDSELPNPLRVCREIGKRLGPRDIIVGDGGDFVATAANVISLGWPQLWMDPGPLGTLGIGPGYAMAASLLRPDARTIVVYGDGSFGLHGLEFEAMVRQRMRVVAIIGNDAAWSQIRRGQVQLYGEGRAIATALAHTRYDRVVEALGGRGYWVEHTSELAAALDAAFASELPACVNVKLGASDFRKGAISV